ncbi:TetR/AcrR family transcriptional regulator [Ferrimonas balearica]|uniref:TetR/AcrR family transcriptional regulator n=1 Tax=Ferrimonas balearica TaxID=44012 RepID=UPI001C994E00|nr:TetR/AcrR family transcriptional regulator [Ferrimonas balearica]MBY5922994.1 TetR/AcrR family transcriptional regulator [Ferrimonas balearica]MBY5997629.1 TetR/AcrR family transcriptional regulator [Ferrimonas balearica]
MHTVSAMEASGTSSWSSPTQTRFRQRDQVLIRLAEQLIRDQGLVSFRFSELAPLAGCSAGTLYKHFSSKEDLLVAIFARHVEQMVERQPHFMTSQLSFAERWVAMHLCAVVAVNRSAWTLGFNTLGGAPKVVERASEYRVQELKMYLEQFYTAILRVVEGARIQGELNATDEEVKTLHAMMACFQRGASGVIHNPLMSNAVKQLDTREIFSAFAILVGTLNWQRPLQEDSYQRIIAEVEHQLSASEEDQAMVAAF